MATSAALPASGNHTGDARLTLDTATLYVWDGDSWEVPPQGPATTADALSADPADCDPGEVAVGITTTADLICAPDAGGVAGPLAAEVGQVATFAATDGQEVGASVLRATATDISSTSDYSHAARVQLGSHKPFGPLGATVTAPCLSRFPSQFTANASAFAVESCTELGPGAATGEILAIHVGDEGGQPPTWVLTSNVYQTGGGGLIFAGEYSTFADEAYRRIAWTDTDTVPALGNLVSFDVGLIRRGDDLLMVNDGTRSGLTSAARDLQLRNLIASNIRLTPSNPPASETSACTAGDSAWDALFEYRCVATNTWVRSAHAWALPAGITDHGDLTGLSDDDHTGYALLAGRAGGQQFTGGTAAGDDINLRSTSNASKGDVLSDSPFLGPVGTNMRPTFACAAAPDTGWYCDGGNKIRFTFDSTNSAVCDYLGCTFERDNGQTCYGDGKDVCLQRSGPDEATITDGGSGRGALVLDRLVIPGRTTAPTCSTPSLYVNSASSNTLCYCNGSTWSAVSGPGPC